MRCLMVEGASIRALACRGLRDLKVGCGGLAGAPIGLKIIRDLLTLAETRNAGPLQRRGVDEHVLAAIVRLNEAVALLTVVPLHRTHIHGSVLSLTVCTFEQAREGAARPVLSMFGEMV